MILQRRLNHGQCLAVSFAMALGIPVQDIFDELGHDGSEILWPHLPEPQCRCSFHPQELIEIALRRGFAVTPFELAPVLESAGELLYLNVRWEKFIETVNTSRGVLTGNGSRTRHAVAYEHGWIYDSDSGVYKYSTAACEARFFYGNCLWRVDRIQGRQDV